MQLICRDRFFQSWSLPTTLVGLLMWLMVSSTPLVAQPLDLPLGLATGSEQAYIALHDNQWATLTASSSPVYDGTMIRTGKGLASALLKDGTQLELQPQSLIRISGSRTAAVARIAVGWVLFRLPSSSRIVLLTPSAQYQASDGAVPTSSSGVRAAAVNLTTSDRVGEIVVSSQGGSRIGLIHGEMLARPANDPGMRTVKVGENVYIPRIVAADSNFRTMLAQIPPGEPAGEVGTAGAGPVLGGVAGSWFGPAVTLTLFGGGVAAAMSIPQRDGKSTP